MYLCRIT